MNVGSLFSGAGGLDTAVCEVFDANVAWHCEVDPAASKVLAHRFPGVPNLGDITQIDWAAVEPVDVLCGGFPCQDVSAAGRRAGIKDGTRSGLWAVFADAIDALRPRIVVIENVKGLLSAEAHRDMESADAVVGDGPGRPVLRAAGAVLGDLSELGFDAQWTTVSAASVGAPHRRERVFFLASPADASIQSGRIGYGDDVRAGSGARRHPQAARRGSDAADASGDGRHEGRAESAGLIRGSDAAISGDGPVALLPTPAASRSGRNQSPSPGAAVRPSLDMINELLPTPNAADGNGGGRYNSQGHQSTLPGTVRDLLPTPTSRDHKGAANPPGRMRDGRLRGSGDDMLPDAVAALLPPPAWGKYEPAIRRWENVTRPAPSPTEPNTKGNPRLSAAFSEWLMGWPAGWVTEVPGISRNDQLRIVGNGVCPQQASAALSRLIEVSRVAA